MANLPKAKTDIIDYVLLNERDLPTEEQTIWKLKSLSVKDYTVFVDKGISATQNGTELAFSMQSGTSGYFAASRGIVGFENLQVDGKDVAFVGGKEEDDGFKRITSKEIESIFSSQQGKAAFMEIGSEIIKLSSISKTEKN